MLIGYSQLLELLLDINDSDHIPPEHRFELGSPVSSPLPSHAVPSLECDDGSDSAGSYDSEVARNALDEAREELANGEISQASYDQQRAQWEARAAKRHRRGQMEPKPFHAILSTPHTSLPMNQEDLPEDLHSPDPTSAFSHPPFFITPTMEEDYLYTLDASLSASPPIVPRHLSTQATAAAGQVNSKAADRDLQTRNPVSVYNWLRRHQPQVFLQDNEHVGGDGTSSTKSGPTGRSAHPRGAKETPKRVGVKMEVNEDDDWSVMEQPGVPTVRRASGVMKRKRGDDDPGYRPKGGSSRVSMKRKREDGAPVQGKKVRKIHAVSNGT
jgi:IEC3 subunit of the Ino80 complex, chromatin re-modelling